MRRLRKLLAISACLVPLFLLLQASSSAQTSGYTWAGTWNSDFGQMMLDAGGSGSYAGFSPGTVTGTVTGNVDKGTWMQPGTPPKQGTFTFTMAADGQSFTGVWAYDTGSCGSSCGWGGTCIAGPCLKNGTTPATPSGGSPKPAFGTDLHFTSPAPGGSLQTSSPPLPKGTKQLTVNARLDGAAPTRVTAVTPVELKEGKQLLWMCVYWGLVGISQAQIHIPRSTSGATQGNLGLAVFIACLKLLGTDASNSARQAAGGCQATGVPANAQPLSPAIRQRMLSDLARKLRASCSNGPSGQLSLSLAASGPGTTIPSLFGSHLRLGLARARTSSTDGPHPQLVLRWTH